MKKRNAIANLLSVILVLVVNGLSQAQRWNNTTVGEISNKFGNLFTPASYAFSIWGLIFLLLLGYGLFQVYLAFSTKKESQVILKTGWWFTIANILNASWVVAFTYDQIALSVGIMIGILFSLLKIIVNTEMQLQPVAFIHRLFTRWPVAIYAGWISVATIANFSAYFSSIDMLGSELNQIVWTMVMITIAILLNVVVVWLRNMRAFAAVAIWALVAIFMRHKESYESIAYYAMAGAAVLAFIILAQSVRLQKGKKG